jgi:olfactory receptor
MIYDLFWKHKVISFKGCVTQIFFIHNIGHVEMVLLLSMSLLCTQPYVSLCTTWPSW